MLSKATTPDEYINQLPDDRKGAVSALRNTVRDNLPDGFTEGMCYGMIGYVVPHLLYPSGYRCDPSKPLMFISLASQKNHIALYHMGLYAGPLLEWFQAEWPKYSRKKLDMGKACVRFKKAEDIPLVLISELSSKMTPQQWIETYEKALKR
jgi:hypothetical protein